VAPPAGPARPVSSRGGGAAGRAGRDGRVRCRRDRERGRAHREPARKAGWRAPAPGARNSRRSHRTDAPLLPGAARRPGAACRWECRRRPGRRGTAGSAGGRRDRPYPQYGRAGAGDGGPAVTRKPGPVEETPLNAGRREAQDRRHPIRGVPMKTLIVYAHPEPESLNGALRDLAVSTLEKAGHEVRVSDLYAMDWKAVVDAADYGPAASAPLRVVRDSGRAFESGDLTPDVGAE